MHMGIKKEILHGVFKFFGFCVSTLQEKTTGDTVWAQRLMREGKWFCYFQDIDVRSYRYYTIHNNHIYFYHSNTTELTRVKSLPYVDRWELISPDREPKVDFSKANIV